MAKIKMLALSLTGKCNFACRYCYASELTERDMTYEIAEQALNIARPAGEKFILQFTGGEPLLNYPVLKKAVEKIKRENIPAVMQLQTNCSLMTDEIAKFLAVNKVGVGISFDGRPSVNDKLRKTKKGISAAALIMQGVEALRRNNIGIGITCVVTKENVGELSGVVEFAYFLGNVRKLGFDILRGQGRGSTLLPPAKEELRTALEEALATARKLSRLTGIKIKFSHIERAKALTKGVEYEFGHCYAMNGEAAFVDPTGDIYACPSLIGDKNFYIGNAKDGINQVLVDNVKEKISGAMRFCKQCADLKKCGGGCFARWTGTDSGKFFTECALYNNYKNQL